MEALPFLIWPFLACVVLTGIHAYLGLHVVKRGVIFVDLSLAQVAALGTTVAVLFGIPIHSFQAYLFSISFTLLGAIIFALSKQKKGNIPQEAFIGIVYAVSAATAILIMNQLPEGSEHLKHVLVGNLIAVDAHTVIKIAVMYSLIGLFHWINRKPFLRISENADKAAKEGLSIRWWDFLFYSTFGIVVTSSVDIAGVLLVFSFLIVPPVTAMLFLDSLRGRLIFSWVLGTVVSVIGVIGSYLWDTPTGATIVCTFGAILAGAAIFRVVFLRKT